MGLLSGFPFLCISRRTDVLVLIPDLTFWKGTHSKVSSLYKEEISAFYCFPKVDKAMLLYFHH